MYFIEMKLSNSKKITSAVFSDEHMKIKTLRFKSCTIYFFNRN